ncbi:hypothetical protein GQ43DRAFT_478683 [Delitschia confertaspora ATCC 74209]|uniref:Rad21/Rec8-like protein N-terminal domain-containing protein n=1 Tax=Delitschia confertaspora ATCC 74209 TaxID=1513339 RepID=A0A9P4MY32_9PLEO|nr:hypothetical protein GQ43DRAFT_478683 [Delitschia confertaspora ATCC 74209]
MFYSNEVLTSRKYGVATVWLVATLGSKSNLKKINRKAILDVNVPKACETIVDPQAPMALRLQSSLLYGISRVYSQQCGYVLSDVQNAHMAMRMMLKVVKDAGLDPEAGKARPDQLILQDDPSFLPDFALAPLDMHLEDLDLLGVPLPPRSEQSQTFTPHTPPGGPMGGLLIPRSSSSVLGGMADIGGFGVGDDTGSNVMESIEEAMPLPEAEFTLDADGNLLELTPGPPVVETPAALSRAAVGSDTGASARVRREHEEALKQGAETFDDQMDLDLPNFGEDVPEGEAFLTGAGKQTIEQPSSLPEESEERTVAEAPLRRRVRAPKLLPIDDTSELQNRELANWNANYLQNMAEASRAKMQHKAITQAKKNAVYWIWSSGIGNIGRQLGGVAGPTPFDMFYGDQLFETLTGISRTAGKKHDRDSGIDDYTQAEARRIRRRIEEEEVGRGPKEEEGFAPGLGEEAPDVELPREAPSALDDHQLFSTMPWNSASIRGSSVIGRPSSRMGPSSLPSLGRRTSRHVSASPLIGRGRTGGLEALRSLEGDDEFGSLSPEDLGFPAGADTSDDFNGPFGGHKTTQKSTGVREALSVEGYNFLTFVSDALAEKRNLLLAEGNEAAILKEEAEGHVEEILFEKLLPPMQSTNVVAAQGLMMVLVLGTRGLLDVRQDEPFGKIGLSVTRKARFEAAAAAAGSEGLKESGDEAMAESRLEGELRNTNAISVPFFL